MPSILSLRLSILTYSHVCRNPGVRSVFGDRLRAMGKDLENLKAGSGVVTIQDDDEADSENED